MPCKHPQSGAEIEDIKRRITQTIEILKTYGGENGLTKDAGEGTSKGKFWRPSVYSHTEEDHVVGLKEDIERLVDLLTTNSNETQVQVLFVVGMGGSGKTTLARKLFNHGSVKQCFGTMTWVPISQKWVVEYGLLDIFKRINEVNEPSDEAQRPPQAIGEKIYKYLEKRKYLIVLDDLWTKEALEEILATLSMGSNGSKVIVTTRSRDVIVDDPNLKVRIHEPRELTAKESWELFRKIALRDAEDTISPMELAKLEGIGKEMLKKCKGLPLAIVALAGVLAKKETLEEWEKVKEAMSSRVMKDGKGTQTYGAVKETLALSYNDLPREIKPCFLYLGIFPEDAKIPIGMLIRMWIAEGFISSNNLQEGETLEDLGREYMNELIGRCVVRVADRNYDGKAKSIEIHDLMRDLCIKKAKELDFLESVLAGSLERDTRVTLRTRRSVVHSYNDKDFFPFLSDNHHLRSLFLSAAPVVGYYCYDVHYYRNRAQLRILPILENFRLLRVLNLVAIEMPDCTLPKEIGSLILLRYLGLMATNITQLPSSIGNLRNLLTLDYRIFPFSEGYAKVPNGLWGIEGLRHIYLPCDPQDGTRFHTLHHLQTLWVEGAGSWMLDELPKVSKSVQKLHIKGITSNEQLEVVFRCPSIKFDCLRSLTLWWDNGREDEGEGEGGAEKETVLKNLECIVNSQHLRKLALRGRIDDRSACFQFPFGIKKLVLWSTKIEAEATLEALGRLPSLMVLHLGIESYIGTKWTCYEGLFSKLNQLWIYKLPELEDWSIKKGAMCQLNNLNIGECTKLTRLPKGLKFVTTLKELELDDMKAGFYRRLRQEDGEDAQIIRHIPVVKFGDEIDD